MESHGQFELPKFSSPEEELKYLRERVAEKEQHMWQAGQPAESEAVISQEVIAYAKEAPQVKLEEHMILENPQFEAVLEHLHSLPHREKIRELYQVLAEKGIMNALRVVQSQNNPHIEDDFHRILVEYIKTGALVPGLDKEKDLSTALKMTVYEVTLPFAGAQEGAKEVRAKEVITAMERFFLGMIPTEGSSVLNYGPFSLEIVISNFSNDIVFYIGMQEHMKTLFVKQILGAFPVAKIEENPADYNIFNEFGVSSASFATHSSKFAYPIQFADEVENDPLMVMLNSFTSIERDGEGAAIQLMVYPDTDHLVNKLKYAANQIRQGIPVSSATDIPLSTGAIIVKSVSSFFTSQTKPKADAKPDEQKAEQSQVAIAMIDEKLKASVLRTNVRIVVSAPTRERADAIRGTIEAAFNQFNRPQGGGLKFVKAEKSKLERLLHNFTFRLKDDDEVMVLNTKELATLYHLPLSVAQHEAPQLKTVKASSAPAPADLPREGTLLGVNKFRGESRDIRMTKLDRLRHLYVIGQTGTGKSVFLTNLIMQDIQAGNGVCFIDPHGSDVQNILAAIPKERIDDVIYFDPSYAARPFALNMLEYDVTHPEQKIFVVNEMLAIFKKLYSSSPESMGPAFEQYFRNATMLVMEDPESGNTLLEIPRVLADPAFRNLKLSRCKNPIVVQFWRDIATKTSGESGLQNMIPYITNKFDVFISNDVMRPIIAQEKSSFNFREIMDNKKILLVNLSKGKLGEMNANLIGLIIIGKFLMAAMSRVDSFGKQLPDFYLYVDEFQNVATPSIAAILSEARKYGLSLNIAHQFIAQLPEDIKAAVFGNVGNMAVFRVGTEDAQFLESQFAPIFKSSDIMKIENRNAYIKMLINGKPMPPFNIEALPPPQGHPEVVEQLKNLSYLKYGRDRATVDDAILKRYMSAQTQNQPVPAPRPLAAAPVAQTQSPAQTLPQQPSISPYPTTGVLTQPPLVNTAQSLGGQASSPPAVPQQVLPVSPPPIMDVVPQVQVPQVLTPTVQEVVPVFPLTPPLSAVSGEPSAPARNADAPAVRPFEQAFARATLPNPMQSATVPGIPDDETTPSTLVVPNSGGTIDAVGGSTPGV